MKMKYFLCDECDGEINQYDEFIQFAGENYCEECFEDHKFDADLCEEGESFDCELCGETFDSGYMYRFDDYYYCEKCIRDNITVTTLFDIREGRLHDRF